jgi:hypothetical protein
VATDLPTFTRILEIFGLGFLVVWFSKLFGKLVFSPLAIAVIRLSLDLSDKYLV